MNKKALVISIHPDDETLGCGGTLLKLKKQGYKIYCIYTTEGNVAQRKVVSLVNEKYSFAKTFNFKFKELDIDDITFNDLIPAFINVINEVKPKIIFIPNRSDVHSDHRRVFHALIAATKSFRFPFIQKVLMYEVISETDFAPPLIENVFQPNVFVDISDFFEKKLEIFKCFKSEILPDNQTRSIRTLIAHNSYRGSLINAQYAESFVLLKEIL